jgi:hypothetical protein
VQAVEIYGNTGSSENYKWDTGIHKFHTVKTHSVVVDNEKWSDYNEILTSRLLNMSLVRENNILPDECKWVKIDITVDEKNALNHIKALADNNIQYSVDIKPNKAIIRNAEEEELPDAFEIQTYNTIRIK